MKAPVLKDALLEIGSEELPASFITIGMQQLKAHAQASLTEHKIAFKSISVYGTPRRLAVMIHELAERSEDQTKFLSGPPEAIAKDAHGAWTPAALGFARKQNLKPTDLRIENGKVAATLHIKGTPARHLLAELFPSWIRKLEFPKSMVWEPSHFRYPRPLRWLTALYDGDPVSFSLAGVRASRYTYGLYLQSAKKIRVASAAKYVMLLKNHCVLAEPEMRIDCIKKLAEQAIRRVHGRVIMHDGLLKQVANLVEHPAAIVGNFDPSYLELPAEVLITCLEHHQKYFPVAAPLPNPLPTGERGVNKDSPPPLGGEGGRRPGEGKLLPYFVGIRNGMSVHQEIVREGYEKVLSARLSDAKFFYTNDRKAPLASRVDALKGVVFQQKLGTLFDKKERVQRLIEGLTAAAGFSDEDKARALRIAELGKADLVTDVVREFPELQGIMARIYAQEDGEDAVVAQGLEQHYWPITLTGALPESPVTALVALVDKLDTLAGDFAVGLIPSGSADPYGLRRAAVGVLRLLEAFGWHLSLEDLLHRACALQPAGTPPAETQAKLDAFFRQRWTALLEERGYKADEIDAVLSHGIGILKPVLARLDALHKVRKQKEFESLAAAYKRAGNILRQADKDKSIPVSDRNINPELLREPVEKQLFEIFERVRQDVADRLKTNSYHDALIAMVPLQAPLDSFFATVMVMSEDQSVKVNRLNFMYRLVQVFSSVADFSKLQNA